MKGRRKIFRPLDRKRRLHIVLKSSHARGTNNFVNNKLRVAALIEGKAKVYGVVIHGCEIMRDHIHIFVSFKSRELIQSFMKVTTGLIARSITKAAKGKPFGKRFWDGLAFTRIITGRRDFASMRNLAKNKLEREEGTLQRRAVEFHESVEREAQRSKISYDEALQRCLRLLGQTF
jgi:REP element-mobilizing transposase RayT